MGDVVMNSREIMKIMEDFDKESGGRLLGVFCGHEHRDRVDETRSFPIVATGASKLEDKARDPLHTGQFTRIRHTPTQELFDVVVVRKKEGGFRAFRYGAGEDREVFREVEW